MKTSTIVFTLNILTEEYKRQNAEYISARDRMSIAVKAHDGKLSPDGLCFEETPEGKSIKESVIQAHDRMETARDALLDFLNHQW